jgi:signal transduction histidine kinase/HPt (histidine-containing phosphotransfer) domain-containing protein
VDEGLDDLRREVLQLMATPGELRDGLARVLARIDALIAAQVPRGPSAQDAQIEEVLDVLFALARLDFSRRAVVHGDGAIDALAQSANMLCEELEVAQGEMQRARTEAEAATLAKSQFLAHVSHEIRTPLTALIGFADLLAVPTLSESDRLNYAMIIRRNGEHLLSVINDILDLSRIEAGRLLIETIPCSPVRILANVASLMRVRANDRGLTFKLDLATPIPSQVRTDPTRLLQILLNLVGNAIKFTREGIVRVVAAYEGRALVIDVMDTGIGMSEEQRAALFQPFQQADLSMTRRYGGSGLGLAISQALAEALGGHISVESVLGRGSKFRLTLPVAADGPLVERVDQAPLEQDRTAAAVRLRGSVLVVEDGVDNQVLIMMLLRGYGLTVAIASDGRAGLQRALDVWRRGSPFDLVLMDMQMPEMDGYQATAALRRDGYPGPIVALTAHAMAGETERCIAAGCTDYLRKPIDRGELVATLRRFLPDAPVSDEPPPLYSRFGDDTTMTEILGRFVGALPERVNALRSLAAARDLAQLERLAHQLKGAAGGYGFPEITEAAASVVDAVQANSEHALILQLVDQLAQLCLRARLGGTG